jgi:hypothetical protein
MPLRATEPPRTVSQQAAQYVHQVATPRGVFPALRDVVREELELVAPHQVYTAGLDALVERGLAGAAQTGWRYLVADRGHIVASVELAGDAGESPLLNGGPYVAATESAVNDLERRPEVVAADFELRFLKVPALHVAAAWLVGAQPLVTPLAPAPSFLEAGRSYTEEEFASALQEPARRALAAEPPSGG